LVSIFSDLENANNTSTNERYLIEFDLVMNERIKGRSKIFDVKHVLII
jgi:hypothetical protein